jgi:hypothetical protein
VILGRKDVAGRPAHVRTQRHQRLDQHGGLDGHVERAGDARALERLGGTIFLAQRHQARHFGFGDTDLVAPEIGESDVLDDIFLGRGESGHDLSPRGRSARTRAA